VGVWNRGEVYASNRHLAMYSGGASGVTYFNYRRLAGYRADAYRADKHCRNLHEPSFGDAHTCSGSETSPMHFTGQHFRCGNQLVAHGFPFVLLTCPLLSFT
jgi:hypothetical protein